MPDNLTVRAYDVHPLLGRHQVLDARSLAYVRPYTGETIRTTMWEPRIPVLNQSDLIAQGIHTSSLFAGVGDVDALGSCTGNAGTAALSVLLNPEEAVAAGLDTTNPVAGEAFAIGLYADATTRDQWHDQTWPTDDCGSSGLGVAKALKRRGLIDQYGHATTAHQIARDLQNGPLLMGMPWREAFFTPAGPSALIDDIPDWQNSPVAGGHEVAVIGLEQVAFDQNGHLVPARTVLLVRNSWGASWGDAGCFRMSLAVYDALRHDIDIVQIRKDPR